jgi:hypothetical protein
MDDAARDVLGESSSANPVDRPAYAGATQSPHAAPTPHTAWAQTQPHAQTQPEAQASAQNSASSDGDEPVEAAHDVAAAAIFAVPHSNGHSSASGAAHSRQFDVLTPPHRMAGSADPGSLPPLGPDGLPHRVRQANLAPQLRSDTPESADSPDPKASRRRRPGGARPPRTPEENRATMSAFQRGFNRGRAEEPAAPPPPAPPAAAEADPGEPADHDERGDGPR